MDFNCPSSLISTVTEKGSGSTVQMSYYDVCGIRGQVRPPAEE